MNAYNQNSHYKWLFFITCQQNTGPDVAGPINNLNQMNGEWRIQND